MKIQLPFKKKKKKETKKAKGWGEKKEKPKKKTKKDVFTDLKYGKSRLIRIPGLKFFNQLLLGILFLINFMISQAALTGGQQSQFMFWIFIANSYGLLYGLWKSRKEKEKLAAVD